MSLRSATPAQAGPDGGEKGGGVLGLDLRGAAGHTKAMNLASNLASLAVFVASSSVRYDVGVVMIAGQLIGARMGSGLVIARGARFIRPVFLTVVVILAARLLWQNFFP